METVMVARLINRVTGAIAVIAFCACRIAFAAPGLASATR
jgi:hypothetical protein